MKALRRLLSISKPSPSLLFSQRLSLFSSATNPSFSNSFSSSDDGDEEEGSGIYRNKLKFQRPRAITRRRWEENLNLGNSGSFIGTVTHPLRVVNNNGGPFGVHTGLRVRNSPKSESSFWILLKMWEEMAELSVKHLKPNDFIYVSGRLGSYTKVDQNGNLSMRYKLDVKELNYVSQHGHRLSSKNHKEPQCIEGGGDLDKYKDRLHLWQVFFSNPYEWWDNREGKKNPRQPDFKHKDTGEALWLSRNDPPWIEKQLQLLDERMPKQRHGEQRSCVSEWQYDE
ncbi:protein OSB1 [Pyrus ussuriensis x Pyrus communis]|uniref:Protein OSB1 n=1 Tax=Pyrus ussuriensis x Pyrus communis TaxID=2448454 RepID=A0A5N5H918_9ROSA|nr:protein OSB1 [Pyrus ussuriensis x Pyrus communis]